MEILTLRPFSQRDLLGKRFLRGIILYTGDQVVPFGSNLYALPVSALWRNNE